MSDGEFNENWMSILGPPTDKKKKVVIFDIDDVLAAWAAKAHEACVAAGLTKNATWTQWNMAEDYGVPLPAWLEVVNTLSVEGGVYHDPPYPGAVEAVRKLWDNGADIHFVTARGFFANPELIRQWTAEWVEKYFGDIPTLWFSQNKGEVAKLIGATHGIDDRFENAISLMEAGVDVYLMDQPHNQTFEFDPYRRVSNVTEFVEKVLRG